MALTKAFWDKATDDWLKDELTDEMGKNGFVFTLHSMTENRGWHPRPSMEQLIEAIGGEETLDGDFDEESLFTIRHKPTGIEIKSNGTVDALARLWLAVKASEAKTS